IAGRLSRAIALFVRGGSYKWPSLLALKTRVSAVVRIKSHLASLCLLSLPHFHANPTGTTGSARTLCISPRLPHPLHPASVERNAEACRPLLCHSLSSF